MPAQNAPNTQLPLDTLDPEIREILALASSAPSGHNTQPWAFYLNNNNHLTLHVDPARELPEVDAQRRETLLSLGCFLETLRLAAEAKARPVTIKLPPLPPLSEWLSMDTKTRADLALAHLHLNHSNGLARGVGETTENEDFWTSRDLPAPLSGDSTTLLHLLSPADRRLLPSPRPHRPIPPNRHPPHVSTSGRATVSSPNPRWTQTPSDPNTPVPPPCRLRPTISRTREPPSPPLRICGKPSAQ
jgi:hypothetical protein